MNEHQEVMYDYSGVCSGKHALKWKFLSELSLAMLPIDDRDKEYWEKRLVEEGEFTREQLAAKPAAWYVGAPYVRPFDVCL
ncbi:hypothetical protein JL722_5228 [Aureococcus anophagefferens]|nr:hypothetical protein JL722_5228 [Aureococcus anophagefferens]